MTWRLMLLTLLALSACSADDSVKTPAAADSGTPTSTSSSPTATTSTAAPTTTSIATTASTTSTTATAVDPRTTAEQRVLFTGLPGDSFSVDLTGADLQPGTALFVVEAESDGLPSWAWVGDVPDDGDWSIVDLRLPTFIAWRLEHGDFGVADVELFRAGRYRLQPLNDLPVGIVEVTEDADPIGFSEDYEEPQDTVDPTMAILRSDGLGDVTFGTPTDQAITELASRFGSPLEDVIVDGCPTYRVLRWANGIHARFDGSFAEFSFLAWDVPANPYTNQSEQEWPPGPIERESFTTPSGFTIGSSLNDLWPRAGYSGGYDPWAGASVWFESDHLGGLLSGDVSEPSSIVVTVEAGRDWNPALIVC